MVTAITAIVGVAIAARGLNRWRAETIGKRKVELAEEVLADFYQARDIIAAARSPFGTSGEGDTRPKGANETEEDTRVLNGYFRAAERLRVKAEFFAQAWARRYRFIAVFGPGAGKAYDDIFEVRNEIIVSVGSLIHAHRASDSAELARARRHWENTIWEGEPDDPIPDRVDQIIKTIEGACRPVIQEAAK